MAEAFALGGTAVAGAAILIATQAESETAGILALGSALVLPSAGHFYAGSPGWGTLQIATRTAGAGLVVAGIGHCLGEDDCSDAEALAYAGIGLFAAGTVWSLIDAPRAAHRYNERQRALVVTPMPVRVEGELGMGLALTGTF
jgi:hypothetical protein